MILWKCYTQNASKFGKLSSGHRAGKGPFSFQSQRKAMPKNIETTTQLYSSHTLAKECSKFSKPRFNSTWTMNFQMFKLDLEKDNHWIFEKAKKVPEKHLLLLYWLCQSLWLCGSQQTGKFLKRWEYQTTLPSSWEICMQIKKQVRTRHGTKDWFQIGKRIRQGCILSPCLFNLYAEYIMQNAGLDEAQGGIKIARRNINNLRYTDDTTLWQKAKNWRDSWWKWKRRVKKLV